MSACCRSRRNKFLPGTKDKLSHFAPLYDALNILYDEKLFKLLETKIIEIVHKRI